jgi:RNA polymerase sigma-70 factor (ECF subfamily)
MEKARFPVIKAQATSARRGALEPGTREAGGDRAGGLTAAGLYEQYLEDIYHYVLRQAPGIEEAEDITVEVFAAAAAALPHFRGQCAPYAWLLSIARRKIIDSRRRRTARPETLASDLAHTELDAEAVWEALATVEGPEAVLMRAEMRQFVRDLLAQLNPDQREAVLLQYVEGLSGEEIAVVMGRSRGAIHSLLHRARATLHRLGRTYFLDEDKGHQP